MVLKELTGKQQCFVKHMNHICVEEEYDKKDNM